MNTLGAHNYLLKDERRGKQSLQSWNPRAPLGPEGCPWSGLCQVVCAFRLISGRCIDDIFLLKQTSLFRTSGKTDRLFSYVWALLQQAGNHDLHNQEMASGGVMKEKLSTWYPP